MTGDSRQEVFLGWARFFAGLSAVKYRSPCGADLPDAELNRLEARAFRRLAAGDDLDAVAENLEAEWAAFAAENNRRVAAAPKVVRGPMSGHSSISHRWADPGKAESSVAHLRRVCRDADAVAPGRPPGP